MKVKTIILLFILFFASAITYAQKGFWVEISVEGKNAMGGDYQVPVDLLAAAPTWADMTKKFTFKGSAGADVSYYFNDYVGLSLGLHYSGTGQDYDDYIWSIMGNSVIAERSVSIHYLQLPLQLRYVISPSQKISFIFAGGFYAGFLLNYGIENKYTFSDGSTLSAVATGDTYSITSHDNSGTDSASAQLLNEPFDPNDFGIILSAGLQFKLSNTLFLPVMFKYEAGFSNIKNKSCQYSFNGDSYFYWEDDFYGSPNINLNHINSTMGLKIGLRFVL